MKSKIESLLKQFNAEQNRLLDEGRKYHQICMAPGHLTEAQREKLHDQWIDSIDSLHYAATNILRWQSHAEQVLKYCAQVKTMLEDAQHKEDMRIAQEKHENTQELMDQVKD